MLFRELTCDLTHLLINLEFCPTISPIHLGFQLRISSVPCSFFLVEYRGVSMLEEAREGKTRNVAISKLMDFKIDAMELQLRILGCYPTST